jgi:hypothetical protein
MQTLIKIKNALSVEGHGAKQMIETYLNYTQGNATEEDMERANQQFQSFLKTIGLGVFAVLPFSPITIPALVKLGKKYGVDVIPESFKKEFFNNKDV